MAPEPAKIAAVMPQEPGIYLMKDVDAKIIYIGKAKNLRKRARSYFVKQQNYKTQKLVENIVDIEFVLTDNESEAFLLESQMIKRHRPKFNIELKDQQKYTYLRVTDEKYPRLVVARRTRDGNFIGKGRTYGPFTRGSSKLLTIGTLRKAFQIRICKTLPKKVCLEYHLGNCEGPCEFEKAQQDYAGHVEALEEVLKGGDQATVFNERLKQEMYKAAELEQFERAMDIRDTLSRLGSLKTEQKIEYANSSDEEYFGINDSGSDGGDAETATVMNFRMINGVIRDSDRFHFDMVGDNSFSNFLYQYYTTHKIPKLIFVNKMPSEKRLLESLLTERAGFKVSMSIPVSGKRKKVIDLIMKNIVMIRLKGGNPGLVELKEMLGLPTVPNIIECFDVSNHGDAFAVGSMARFVDGRPDKSGYRRFMIKTVTGRNDFAMIGEITHRRYSRLLSEGGAKRGNGNNDDDGATDTKNGKEAASKGVLPDLVVIDGGKGQLGAAIKSLKALGVGIPCIGLAKENEEIHTHEGAEPIIIPKNKQSLKILQHVRDETHRFGVAYNRTVQRKRIVK